MKRLLLFIFVFAAGYCRAQASADSIPKYQRVINEYVAHHLEKKMSAIEGKPVLAVDGKTKAFAFDGRPVFLYCGMEHCMACDKELPYYYELAQKMPELRFVYLSFDTQETTRQHMNRLGLKGFEQKVELLVLDQDFIRKERLAFGYPTKFFLDKNGVVKKVEPTSTKDPATRAGNWENYIHFILNP